MVDQVAIFFLAGHETSASALAWALYLLALYPDWQDTGGGRGAGLTPDFAAVVRLRVTRDVFREALRLYPPVPMMVRETTCPEQFRDRDGPPGAQVVLSPWHLHRHERLWDDPDAFDPAAGHTENGKRLRARCLYAVFRRPAGLHRGGVCDGRGAAAAGACCCALPLRRRARPAPGAGGASDRAGARRHLAADHAARQ